MSNFYWGDDEDLSTVIGELAGYTSVCWEPRPHGEFDSEDAADAVEAALVWINEHYIKRENV